MKKKSILIFLILIIFCLIDTNVYATSSSTKCIYEETDLNKKITFTITPNGKGNVSIDSVEFSDGGYQANGSNISTTNFIDKTNNIIKCPNYLYIKMELGTNYKTAYTLNFNDFTGASKRVFNLKSSENDGQSLTSNNGVTEVNSCSYTGTINKEVVANITVHAYSDNTLSFETSNSKFPASLNANSKLTATDFNKSCPKVTVYCGNDGSNGSCYLTENSISESTKQNGNTTPSSETINAEYTCSYKGKITGASLTISKTSTQWIITNPGGGTSKLSVSKTGLNILPTSECEDIFYIYDSSDKIRTIIDNKYARNNIAQYCNNYENVEQFCNNNECKISNPLCGNTLDSENDFGECPKELKPIFVFVKRIAFNTLKIAVPIILILMGIIDMARAVMSSDDKGMKEATSRFIKRIISAILVFFVVTIVTIVIDMFAKTDLGDRSNWKACWFDID